MRVLFSSLIAAMFLFMTDTATAGDWNGGYEGPDTQEIIGTGGDDSDGESEIIGTGNDSENDGSEIIGTGTSGDYNGSNVSAPFGRLFIHWWLTVSGPMIP